jgi:hypothetical protein
MEAAAAHRFSTTAAGLDVHGGRGYFHVANIGPLAAVITATVTHPSTASHGGFDRDPMIARLLVSKSTMTMSGGASTPFKTAAQNSMDTALKPQ